VNSSIIPPIPSSILSSRTPSFSSLSSGTGTSYSSSNSFASSSSSTAGSTLVCLQGIEEFVARHDMKDKKSQSIPSGLSTLVPPVRISPSPSSLIEDGPKGTSTSSVCTPKTTTGNLDIERLLASVSGPAGDQGKALVRDIGFSADMNAKGLRRGKKRRVVSKNGDNVFTMEDTETHLYPFQSDPSLAYIGVFDGFSGEACAHDAMTAVPEAVAEEVLQLGGREQLNEAAGFWERVYARADKALSGHEDVGCTATSVLVWESGGKRYVQGANCGDSNAYLFVGGTARMLTTEHKVTAAAEKKRAREMNPDLSETATRINGVAVARALGVHFIKEMKLGIISEPSVSDAVELPYGEEALLIVASDGLWDVISGQEAGELVSGLSSAQEMSEKLLRAALHSPKCVDNVTVVVAKL